ncbi:MAG: protein kinase [Deltaproteobacteria bacterium]
MTTASITCEGCKHAYAENALFCPNCGRPKLRAESTADPLIGKLLGDRFLVQELIGQGGSGSIYRAEHVTLRRKVAIKVLHNELSRDDLAVERFRREATTVAEIDNEHIVEIHDFGRIPDGRLYLAMELLEGETLDHVLARETTLSVERAADILIQVGEALMEAHAIGYVHRDLRPRNVYLAVRRGKANFVKLLDFGLAKLVETDASAASTSLGMTFGDPRYMSPEQARGDRIDRRADIYQLGCVAYEMLTGQPPFTGNRVFDILTKQVTDIPAPLPTRRPGVPLWMEAAVAKMLAKDPVNRFATTTRMVEALRRGLETGEVMEDEIARRRESIPPPSVSRVMQKMGMTSPADSPREHMPQRELPPLPPAPVQAPVAAAPVAAAPATPPAAVAIEAPAERRRTGTPEVGVPVAPAPVTQPAVAGAIDRRYEPTDKIERVKPPVVAEPRAKRASSQGSLGESSASWYEEGERAAAAAHHDVDDFDDTGARELAKKKKAQKAKKLISPSSTDLSMYDTPARNRRGLVLFAMLGVAVIGGGLAFALTRTSDPTKPPPLVPQPQPVATITSDAAPSQVIETTPDASVASVQIAATEPSRPATPTTQVTTAPAHPTTTVAAHPTTTATHPTTVASAGSHDHDRKGGPTDFDFGVNDGSRHHPTGPGTTTTTNPSTSTSASTTKPGGNVTGGPQDPYGTAGDPPADPGDAGSPEKKAEFYAGLGQQQMVSSDTAGAAASFKKSLELDPKNVAAVSGMGEIALRQGLFGDAIAHLKKAARLAPKSSNVFTLLGEAYLNSGQSSIAADNFKKALQLDPDNKRAREGYDDASSKVPPPTDDN